MSKHFRSRLPHIMRSWFSETVLGPHAQAYVTFLANRGYAEGTINSYLRCVAHFAHWSQKQQAALDGFDEALVTYFVDEHLPSCRCARRCSRAAKGVRAALGHLLELLRANGLIAEKTSAVPVAIAAELEAFDRYLAEVRGLQDVTRRTRLAHVLALLRDVFADDAVRIDTLIPADIERFTIHYTAGWQPASVKQVGNSLRSYLRFKATLGVDTAALIAVLPHVAQWRLSRLPRGLLAQELEQLLGAFDRNTATGRRDYAIARCYVDLGLRTTEIARLELEDIDWDQGTVRIRGKGPRTDTLPLPETTGHAIVEYARSGRRRTSSRALFLRHRPPLDKATTADTVRAVIRNAAQRCGLADRLTGTHILRHTLAHRLVRSGASLKDIADLLRHRSLDTTTIYAKVDLEALASVAAPWPGRQA